MSHLISAGVSVTVTDESFFIPSAAPTVPLLFIATEEERFDTDPVGNQIELPGTFEHGIVRTITSLRQSTELYGTPRFIEDSSGNPHHGDARNEYGLFALNQFLRQGSLAYVVRANVNLNDDISYITTMWDRKITDASFALENAVNALILETNQLNNKFFGDPFTSGLQDVDFANGSPLIDVPKVGTDLLGLTPGVYTTNIVIDGTSVPITFTAVGGEQFNNAGVNDLIPVLNTQMGGLAVASMFGGNVRITSASTGITSTINIVEPTVGSPVMALFGSLTDFTALILPVNGVDGFKETVTQAEYLSLVNQVMTTVVYTSYTFGANGALENHFEDDSTLAPLLEFANGFTLPSTGAYPGVGGLCTLFVSGNLGSNPSFPNQYTAQDASDELVAAADSFKFTQEFVTDTSLGGNDAARRTTIVQQLQSEIVGNFDIRSENFEWNIVLTPGYHEVVDVMESLVGEITSIQEEAIVIGDTPVDFTPEETVNWAATTAKVSSIHVAYYYPWQLIANLDGKDVLASPAGTALAVYTFSDNVSQVWFAPAGVRRGAVDAQNLGIATGTLGLPTVFTPVYLTLGDRDNLYKQLTAINPIVFFPGRGLLIWGQRTSIGIASALDRVNVKRLIAFIKRALRKNTLPFVFEPNDQLTRDNLKATVDGFLSDIVVKRGLFDFATLSDETNNTPQRVDNNELYIDIALKPVKAAEFLHIPIRIVSTGASI